MQQQAVVVNVPLRGATGHFTHLQDLGDRLEETVEQAGVGVFDGNLIGEDWGILYLCGPDADVLWQAIEDTVRAASLPSGTYVVKQHGPPGGPETRIEL